MPPHGVAVRDDPAERKRQEREGDTLADVAERYLDDLKARAEAGAKHGRLSGWEASLQLWNKHVPPALQQTVEASPGSHARRAGEARQGARRTGSERQRHLHRRRQDGDAQRGGSGGKGGAPRTLPLGAATIDLLRRIKPDDVDLERSGIRSTVVERAQQSP